MRTPFDLIQAFRSWFHAKDAAIFTGGHNIDTGGGNIIVGTGTVDGVDLSALDHGADLAGLADDDHTQYHNDTRGDARYFQQSEFSSSTGVASAPLETDSGGLLEIEGLTIGGGSAQANNIIASGNVAGSSVIVDSAGVLSLGEGGSPGTPSSGSFYVYAKTDGKLYVKNDAGTEALFFTQAEFSSNPGASSKPLETDSSGFLTTEKLTAGAVSATATGLVISSSGLIRLGERSAPGTPASGTGYIYVSTSGDLHFKNDAGTDTNLTP